MKIKKFKKLFNMYMSEGQFKFITELSNKKDLSVAEMIRTLIDDEIVKQNKEKK